MNSKRTRGFVSALATVVVGFVVLAPWSLGGSRELRLRDDVALQGRTVRSGSYTLAWTESEGSTQSVEVTVRMGTKVLASATGTQVTLDRVSDYDGLVFRTGADGTREIFQIVFAGRSEAIRFEPVAQAQLH